MASDWDVFLLCCLMSLTRVHLSKYSRISQVSPDRLLEIANATQGDVAIGLDSHGSG